MLEKIAGIPMILHVFRCVKATGYFKDVCVATDDQRIFDLIQEGGGRAIITDPNLPSGTDRIIAALENIETEYDFVVNVQGDEALISEDQLGPLVSYLNANPQISIATLCTKNKDFTAFQNPNCVKVVSDKNQKALYFSRASIPVNRDEVFSSFLQHIGVYAFAKSIIDKIIKLQESELEKKEKLEQLRWMQAGIPIHVIEVKGELIGVDTKEDLEKVEKIIDSRE